MTDEAEAAYRRRLVLAYVASLTPSMTDEETASVTRVPGDLRTTLAWVLQRRGDVMPVASSLEGRPRRNAHRMLLVAVLAALLLMVPASAF